MADEPEHERYVVSENQGWRMVRIRRALWRLCTRIVGSYYRETRDALIEAACGGGSYIGFVRTLDSFVLAQDLGATFGLDTSLDAYELYHLHVAVLHASRRQILAPYHDMAVQLYIETQSPNERRGTGDPYDPASPRYVIWSEANRPRNPLGQHEAWVDELRFSEEDAGAVYGNLEGAPAGHAYGAQAGDLGPVVDEGGVQGGQPAGGAANQDVGAAGEGQAGVSVAQAIEVVDSDEAEDSDEEERVERGVPRDARDTGPRW
ncbi:hypothetical protein HYPSUDRAFT_919509 [Hypholoma sublateritium FD-334 SS-4]|uniref:Uncharacterized protein n=1 Tax=Hypholoma sublateritium (strain FD-334 SS-4) TaxID=945553 RepID=A0A0D2NIB0_HYPSF|nr:hypothetical protein HYPSUDRAFT_919509 [Hypholoma sublateritium FD-334 SS-4]